MSAPVVELRGGTVAYDGRVPALRDADVVVEAGEVVAVLGANGSGKSTLVRAVLGLTPLSAGSVALFGTPLDRFRDWPRIGYVPQRTTAGSGVSATVREVVATGRLSRMGRLRPMREADRRAVSAALQTVDLLDRARDSVTTLSGGQQQRVLIARALAGEPDLLIFDEPTAGVDTASQAALATTMSTLVERGATVVVVTHEIGPMHRLFGRALTLADGRVLHDGPPPEPDHLHLHDPEHAHPPHDVPAPAPTGSWGLR